MIIKRLTLHNFGVYAGTNTFYFHGKKPIVLIGGLNGHGKTTFLEAVLLSLYGAKSFAYQESAYKSYGSYLRSFVNTNDGTKESYLELEFIVPAEKTVEYMIHRSWDSKNKRQTAEKLFVTQDGRDSDFLTRNWPMVVENMLPSALSNFFFFDGEKIAELAVDETDTQMKESIRAMLGLTTLDTLQNDLRRVIGKSRRTQKESAQSEQISTLRADRDLAQEKVVQIDQEIDSTNKSLEKVRTELEQAKIEYNARGGNLAEKRQELFKQRSVLTVREEQNMSEIINMASTPLPFAMVQDLLKDVELRAGEERNEKNRHQTAIEVNRLFNEYTRNHKQADAGFLDFINEKLNTEEKRVIYDLPEAETYQISRLLTNEIREYQDHVIDLEQAADDIKKSIEEIDKYLAVDINEKELQKIYKRIKTLEQEEIELNSEAELLQEKRGKLSFEASRKNSEFIRSVTAFLDTMEAKDDARRTIKYANMAQMILKDYSVSLQRHKIGKLAQVITECYRLLSNKKTLIDHIEMDPDTLDLYYIGQEGNSIPKAKLSAGEKQLMVIAILWALARCSKKKLPVIIDTPLSRLDSAHRKALIKIYFPQASDQTIILSTDTEIYGDYYDMMKPNIGDEFCLEYDEKSKSTTIREGYFSKKETETTTD